VTPADVQNITNTSAPSAVVSAVVDHMSDKAAMPVAGAAYDPAGDGTGRCTTCHMPMTAISAEYDLDAAGNLLGDLDNHTFRTVWPNVSELTKDETGTNRGITNSCGVCHPIAAGDVAAEIIDQWVSDPDDDDTFHAGTPANFQTGVANPERNGGVACVSCHTTAGFIEVQVFGSSIHDLTGAGDAATRTAMVKDSIGHDQGITCNACHGRNSAGNFASGDNPLRFPRAELCGRCHNNETVLFEDYAAHGEIVRHPQREMLAGNDGAEVSGESYGNSFHTTSPGSDCTACHYPNESDKSHDFEPTLSACQNCHNGLTTFDREARDDYDGNGDVDGIQTEIDGCMAILLDAILTTPTHSGAAITYGPSHTFEIDGDAGNTGALDDPEDTPFLIAMFDYNWVDFDASRGIHNTRYALNLIQNAYENLTELSWPGVKRN
jgi:hypothetical protein